MMRTSDRPRAESTGHAEPLPATVPDTDDLVAQHLPLVGHLVREVSARVPAHVHRDDLVSAAMFALAASARSFDASRGAPFARFASIRIRGALADELRSLDWASRGARRNARRVDATRTSLTQTLGRIPTQTEVAHAMGVATSELAGIEADAHRAAVVHLQALPVDDGAELVPDRAAGPEALLLKREQIGYLRDAVALLPARLRLVIEQYFFAQRTMSDIARELEVTESRVSQLRSEALTMLRAGMSCVSDAEAQSVDVTAATGRSVRITAAFRDAVAARSTVSGRLTATNALGECEPSFLSSVPTAG